VHDDEPAPRLCQVPVLAGIGEALNVVEVAGAARYYATAVRRISRVGAVIGELLDSSDEKAITVAGFQARAESYLHALGARVSIWEIGNEVNGSWTGPYPAVAAKLTEAYDDVAAAGGGRR